MLRIFIGKFFCIKFITLSTERHTELSKLYGVFISSLSHFTIISDAKYCYIFWCPILIVVIKNRNKPTSKQAAIKYKEFVFIKVLLN